MGSSSDSEILMYIYGPILSLTCVGLKLEMCEMGMSNGWVEVFCLEHGIHENVTFTCDILF